MFAIDIETLGLDSNAVVLSAAIIHFDPANKDVSFNDLLMEASYVKFDAKEQIEKYNRTITKSTVDWWKTQSKVVRDYTIKPSAIHDHSLVDGMSVLYDYVNSRNNGRKETMWSRGSLDQLCLDSLSRAIGNRTITEYYNWRDFRTAIDILYGTSRGYCEINDPTFDPQSVIKHLAHHDVCYDVMMLLKGKESHE